jgi:tetratricopeptide (TPR) repeat protein
MLKNFDAAIADFTKITELAPKLPDGWILLGRAKMEKNELEAALAHLDEAVKLDPKNVGALYFRSIAFEKKGDLASALADATLAQTVDPKDRDISQRVALLKRKVQG